MSDDEMPRPAGCLCTWEHGDSDCPVHPTCAECGLATAPESQCECARPLFVCPGCLAVGGEECAGYCPDAAIERDRQEAQRRADECECGFCAWCAERDDYLEEYDRDDFSA